MKNDRTPRCLADCEFTTGYPKVPRPTGSLLANLAYAITLVAAYAAIGVMLAQAGVPT